MSEPLGSKITVLLGRGAITAISIAMLVGCTGSGSPTAEGTAASSQVATAGHGKIMSLQLAPIPEGPMSPIFRRDARASERFTVVLRSVARYIPHPLPPPLDQGSCETGGNLVVTFADGYKLAYGPCRRPASIDRLWAGMEHTLNHS